MAELVGAIGTSHIPAVGVAIDKGRTQDDYWKPYFDKLPPARREVARVALDIPKAEVDGDGEGLLVLGWGSTYGAITGAVRRARAEGRRVGHLHLRYLNPMPSDLEAVLARYDQVLIPEMNLGQLALLIRARFLRDVAQLNKVQGQPFKESEILGKIQELAPVKEGVRA